MERQRLTLTRERILPRLYSAPGYDSDLLILGLSPSAINDRWQQEDTRLHLDIMDAIKGSIRW